MPEQRDPLEQLSQFGAGFTTGASGGPMPHSAVDARRRGDQIRRRRTAVVAGGAALAVAAVTVPVLSLLGSDGPGNDRTTVAKPPSRSLTLGVDDLLSDGETAYNTWGEWQEDETFEGDGQSTTFECQQATLSSLGATGQQHRTWDFAVGGQVDDSPGSPFLAEVVAEFPDAATAEAAYAEVTDWISGCSADYVQADEVRVIQDRPVAIPGGEGVIHDLQWGPAPVELDPYGDQAYINETGVVLLDDRIAVLSLTIIGQDYNWLDEYGGTPVTRMLPVAAERLAPGPNVPVLPESVEDPEAATGDTVVSDDFPLAAGWPADGEQEPGEDGLTGPARDLAPLAFEACEASVPDAPGNDRLSAMWSDVEDYRTRQLTSYATVAEAEAAIEDVANLYRGCPEGQVRGDGFTPHWTVQDGGVGDESYAVLSWDELDGQPTTFGSTLLLVRVGNAVLVAEWAGHSGNPQGREDEVVAEMTTETAAVVEAMCAFDPAGC